MRSAILIVTSLGASGLAGPSAAAQQSPFEGTRPARWSLQLDAGMRLPGSIYDQFVERTSRADTLANPQTRWRETASLGAMTRLTLRLNPENGLGGYLAGLYGHASTEANFSGSALPPESIDRSTTFSGVEFGLTMKLKDWAGGRGVFAYSIGGVVLRQNIDLRPGHRDSFAFFRTGDPPDFDWQSRITTSMGASLGASFRVPIDDHWSFRASFSDMVVPVNTTSLAAQDREDILRFSGVNARTQYRSFTAHHMSMGIGIEYTFGFGTQRRAVRRRVAGPDEVVEVDPVVRNAIRMASEGDTAGAAAALVHRVSVEPLDARAWRELALLRAGRADADPSVRDEALATLERALNLNPGDSDLLRAYGLLRALVEREGRLPPEDLGPALELSELVAAGSPDGSAQLGLAVRGLRPDADGRMHYRIDVDVLDEEGERVRARAGVGGLEETADGTLFLEAEAPRLPLSLAPTLFLEPPVPGMYTVRVRFTDIVAGAREEVTAGFRIPGA